MPLDTLFNINIAPQLVSISEVAPGTSLLEIFNAALGSGLSWCSANTAHVSESF